MRRQSIMVLGLGALVLALVVAAAPRAATPVPAISHSIDIVALTKAAHNLPVQAFPAH